MTQMEHRKKSNWLAVAVMGLNCAASLFASLLASTPDSCALGQELRAHAPDSGQPPSPPVDPSTTVAAILVERCLACHNDKKSEGNYSLSTLIQLRKAGDSNRPPLVAGQPEASEFYRRLTTTEPSERMPADSEPLSQAELQMINDWLAAGARVPAGSERLPLAQWARATEKPALLQRYPVSLPIVALAWKDPQTLVTSGYGEVLLWNILNQQLIGRVATSGRQVADIDVSRDGQWLAVSSGTPGARGYVDVWRFASASVASRVWSGTASDVPSDIAFSPDNSRLAIGYQDGVLQVLPISDDSQISADSSETITPHADAILAVTWSDDNRRLMTGSRDRTAKIFEAGAIELIANYDRHQRAVGGVAYIGDKPVSLDETGQLRLWSGDDNDKTVAEQANLARFLEHISACDEWLYVPEGADVRVLRVERKQVDDGKDDKGEPKKKSITKWSEAERLQTAGRDWLLSLSVRQGQVAAGNEAGEVFIWIDRKASPAYRFLAKP